MNQKKLSELKTDEVFDWPKMGGRWKVNAVTVRNQVRGRPDSGFIEFWFETVDVHPKKYMSFVKGIDKDDSVEMVGCGE